MSTLKFEDGSVQFRQRIAVSILSHRNLLIRNIRNHDSDTIGLQNHEASFLRLIDGLTNGSHIEINSTGTQLRFRPGVIVGGTLSHECAQERSVAWFLEGILPLLPFAKEASEITLSGITEGLCEQDASMEYWKVNLPKVMKQFGIIDHEHEDFMDQNTFALEILHRSSDASGRIRIEVPILRSSLSPIDWTETGKIKRIRGLILSSHASTMARTAFATKGVLQQLIPDIWIHTERIPKATTALPDHQSRLTVTLTAETTTGDMHTIETAAVARRLPEDTGTHAAATLLQTLAVQGGGVITGNSMASLILLWMCLTPEDVSRVRLGSLTPYVIESLRVFKSAFGVEFKITPDVATKTVVLSCLGTGYRNMARAST